MRTALPFLGLVLVLSAACSSPTASSTSADASGGVLFDTGGKLDAAPTDSAGQDAASDTLADTLADTSADAPSDTSDDAITDASADSGPDLPDVAATCPGAPGCSCSVAGNCSDGLCIDTPDGKRCAFPCQASCATGYSCADVGGKQACVPTYGKLCQPCNATKDCDAAGISGALCVDEGALGRFCGAACTTDVDCPGGYACLVGQSPEGPKSLQCVKVPPSGSSAPFGTCTCTQASKAGAASTQCFAEQKDTSGKIVGKCPGLRTCGPTGIGACTLAAPKAEVCDGIDNDCNGQIDESAGGCSAGEACIGGKCTSECSPVDGGWSAWAYSPCTQACGGGTRDGTRTCTNPKPVCGGKACVGDATTTEACNTAPCVGGSDLPTGTSTFSNGGEISKRTIPAGSLVLAVRMWGGGGAGGAPGRGGGGAYVQASVPVSGGDVLEIKVAGGGSAPGGGGGASVLMKNGATVLIAGGGGGAGVDGCTGCIGTVQTGAGGGGGAIGGTAQDGGADNAYSTNSGGGTGGSQVAGGAGGKQNDQSIYDGCEIDGTAGKSGAGGACAGGYQCMSGPAAVSQLGGEACIGNGSGGAGGSGWFGGGSGSAKYTYSGGGGGGGSSWADVAVTVIQSAAGTFDLPGGTTATGYQAEVGKGGPGALSGGPSKPEHGHAGLIILTL
jgi:hypothetical protein